MKLLILVIQFIGLTIVAFALMFIGAAFFIIEIKGIDILLQTFSEGPLCCRIMRYAKIIDKKLDEFENNHKKSTKKGEENVK